jgi:hypothetical protein
MHTIESRQARGKPDEEDFMYNLVFHVPESHLEQVKSAVFSCGAGAMAGYSHCCWQVLGSGQFLPLEGSSPAIGSTGRLEHVSEYRVEMMVDEEHAAEVVQALIASHPYEVPSYHLVPVLVLDRILSGEADEDFGDDDSPSGNPAAEA